MNTITTIRNDDVNLINADLTCIFRILIEVGHRQFGQYIHLHTMHQQ